MSEQNPLQAEYSKVTAAATRLALSSSPVEAALAATRATVDSKASAMTKLVTDSLIERGKQQTQLLTAIGKWTTAFGKLTSGELDDAYILEAASLSSLAMATEAMGLPEASSGLAGMAAMHGAFVPASNPAFSAAKLEDLIEAGVGSLAAQIDSSFGASSFGVVTSSARLLAQTGALSDLSEAAIAAVPELAALVTPVAGWAAAVYSMFSLAYGGISDSQQADCSAHAGRTYQRYSEIYRRLLTEPGANGVEQTALSKLIPGSPVTLSRFEGRSAFSFAPGRVVASIIAGHIYTQEPNLASEIASSGGPVDSAHGYMNNMFLNISVAPSTPELLKRKQTRLAMRDTFGESGLLSRLAGASSLSSSVDGDRTLFSAGLAIVRDMMQSGLTSYKEILLASHHYTRNSPNTNRWDQGSREIIVPLPPIDDAYEAFETCDSEAAAYSLMRSHATAAVVLSLLRLQ